MKDNTKPLKHQIMVVFARFDGIKAIWLPRRSSGPAEPDFMATTKAPFKAVVVFSVTV